MKQLGFLVPGLMFGLMTVALARHFGWGTINCLMLFIFINGVCYTVQSLFE